MTDNSIAYAAALKTAIATALTGTATFHDGYVPPSTSYPYVAVEQEDAVPMDFLANKKDERYITLGIYSRYRGSLQVRQIAATIKNTVHQKKLALTGGRNIRTTVTRVTTRPDSDGETFQAQVVIRALTEQ